MKKAALPFWILLCLVSVLPFRRAAAQHSAAGIPPARPVLDIVLVLDNSGSMLKNDPGFLTPEVVGHFLANLADSARIGMVLFDRDARLLEPIESLANSVDKARFLKSLDKLTYKGQLSDSPAAVERALYELKTRRRPEAAAVIILLTDGIVDTGDPRKDAEKYRWLKDDLAAQCAKEAVRIFGIAFSDQADYSLIQALAFKTGGEYYRAFAANEIGAVFAKIDAAIGRPPLPPVSAAAAEKSASQPAQTVNTIAPPPRPQEPSVRESAAGPPEAAPAADDRRFIYIAGGLILLLGAALFVFARGRKSGAHRRTAQEAIPLPRAELVDAQNVTDRKTLPIERRIVTIGRDRSNTFTVPHDTVSSLHAVIEYRDGFYYLEDQRSRNGTRLNGVAVAPHDPRRLKSGDIICLHTFKFIFLLPDRIPAGDTVMDFGAAESEMTRTRNLAEKPPPAAAGARVLPQAMLIDLKNVTGRKTVMLDKNPTTVGRGVHNDVDIPKSAVSGSHAAIEYRDGTFFLEDQRSKNGTRLNGQPLESFSPRKLKSGDEIAFDVYKFIFLLEHQIPTGDTEESL